MNIAINDDCMEIMREYPDKCFDLAVVDPPYGSGGGKFAEDTRFGGRFDKYLQDCPDWRKVGGKVRKKIVSWDYAPSEDYFKELFRVSKEQIIWGGNYFQLPPNRCFLVWLKTNIPENFSMAMAEYAWCSFNDNAKVIKMSSAGIAGRFHPTQKPEELYRWIYSHYTKPGYKVLDTHLGSGSSRRAAYDFALDFVGIEIDKEYFQKQEEAFEEYTAQQRIF
jgi:site-specific DNA-methyltransferase (adenine-specific)|nr:MAG TPA: adenine specific DNA methyltransferase [Caudoviricetes sp.]